MLGGVALNLNFKGLDPLVPEMVTRILHELVESVKRIPIEIKNLNSKPFIPVKDYEQEELIHAGLYFFIKRENYNRKIIKTNQLSEKRIPRHSFC